MLLLCCKLSSTLILHSYRIDSNWSVRNIVVLNLRNNWLTDMLGLGLYNLPNLIELDLACNHFQGGVRPRSIPPSVQRLDLSFNDISDLKGLITCKDMLALNLSHNSIRNAEFLPGKSLPHHYSNIVESAATHDLY